MKRLDKHKKNAISLRKKGLTYSKILKLVPVAKSSISLWCRDIKLSQKQVTQIQKAKIHAVRRGAVTRQKKATLMRQATVHKAASEITSLSDKELWLIGIALYWAEGSKQRQKSKSEGVKFTNSDPQMIKVFNLWLTKVMKVKLVNIQYEIYLHESMAQEKAKIITYWSKTLKQSTNKFDRIYLKKNKIVKHHLSNDYKGVMRIVVKRSSNFNRQLTGWQQGIVNSCRVV
jgi:hypothetical protein